MTDANQLFRARMLAGLGCRWWLAGCIGHPTARVLTLSYAPDWRGQPTKTRSAPVSAAGNFELVLPALAAPTEARLGYAGRFSSLCLVPGYNLRVRFDARQPDETVRYAGRGAAENNYLAQSYRQASQDDAAGRTPDARAATLGAAALRKAAAAYRQQRLAALGAYARAFGVQALPSYWLIGPDGALIASSPPRPSAGPALRAALEAALKP